MKALTIIGVCFIMWVFETLFIMCAWNALATFFGFKLITFWIAAMIGALLRVVRKGVA